MSATVTAEAQSLRLGDWLQRGPGQYAQVVGLTRSARELAVTVRLPDGEEEALVYEETAEVTYATRLTMPRIGVLHRIDHPTREIVVTWAAIVEEP